MSVTDELLTNAERYAAGFDKGDLPLPPAQAGGRRSPAWTPGSNAYGLLGLSEGDAHVIRNAGGVVTADELRSLAISQRLLGTREIILIHHTDCGMLTFTDDDFGRHPGRGRHQADLGRRGVRRPRRGRRPVDQEDHGTTRSSRTRTRCAGSSTRSRPGALREVKPYGGLRPSHLT